MSGQEIGHRLRAERKRLDLTQAQLGTVGGVSLSSQHAYESSTHSPDARYLSKIATAGVDIQYVLLGERPRPVKLTDDEVLAISEISRVVHAWASKRSEKVPPETQSHLIHTFFQQYQATHEIRHESYEQTLGLVG